MTAAYPTYENRNYDHFERIRLPININMGESESWGIIAPDWEEGVFVLHLSLDGPELFRGEGGGCSLAKIKLRLRDGACYSRGPYTVN
ncbi:hypothetical protein CEXT_654321 [Caerostris extrusa]|uniref:Uncharacterized protein n=1 Tax=Caerostris extrusa TaxID=172846 RepID=A0AAV4VJA1_CAEEX|nr:hypothetical protein CEXT_654321 [Caerostris extrusa]